MMKKQALWLFGALLVAVLLAPGMQKTTSQTAAKASTQTAVDGKAAREAAENRLCEGLKVVQAKLGELERSLSSATRFHSDFKAITGRIKSEKLIPLFEKRTLGTAKTAQVKTEPVPVEQTRTITRITGQVRGIKEDVNRIRGTLRAQLADLKKSWGVIERDMKRASGLRKAAGATPSLPCVVEEAKRAQGEMATLGAQANNLQSQIDDLRDMLEQEYGQGPCGDPATCPSVECKSCCAWKCKITAAEGTAERSAQEKLRAECELACMQFEIACAFKNFDQKADQLFNILSTVLKNMKEMESGIVRNLLG